MIEWKYFVLLLVLVFVISYLIGKDIGKKK